MQNPEVEPTPTAVILLKTKSTPQDPYEEYLFCTGSYNPIFVPVLKHTQVNLDKLCDAISLSDPDETVLSLSRVRSRRKYDALIITSQRAVEALSSALDELSEPDARHLQKSTRIYVVGPATRNSLIKIGFAHDNILGHESGNGEALAAFIINDLGHYNSGHGPPTFLFLVGETHRDIIPKTLKAHNSTIKVDELIVYETETRKFENELAGVVDTLDDLQNAFRWLVVFSPAGTDQALKVMHNRMQGEGSFVWRICTIGPTTRDYMMQELGVEPDAVAETPTPEGLIKAISSFAKTTKRISMRQQQEPL